MIENPQNYVEAFIKAGANMVSVHVEEGYHLDRTLNLIKSLGAKAGVAINPATPIEDVFSVLDIVDFVLIMTVNPGFGGQSFIEYTKDKIKRLRSEIDARGLDVQIEIDGGVKLANAEELSKLGTNIFVAGSAVFNTDDYAQTVEEFKKKIQSWPFLKNQF